MKESRIVDLKDAILGGGSIESIRDICKGNPLPEHLRSKVWQIYLGVYGKNMLANFDGLYDMEEQARLREDCSALVDKLGNEDGDKVSIVSDLETVVTCYCKTLSFRYSSSNGWLEMLQPLLSLRLSCSELYNCFYSITTKFVRIDKSSNGERLNSFRLLLQYHDPELSSFLDTHRTTPAAYLIPWLGSLFAGCCDLYVCLAMWDILLCQADPYLPFFYALVLLVNSREVIMEAREQTSKGLTELIQTFPQAMAVDDVMDFCSLAQHFMSKTPVTFKQECDRPVVDRPNSGLPSDALSSALCLPVSAEEVVQAHRRRGSECHNVDKVGVRFFVVDCRPASQYNSGHLPIAFHLDANLMLLNPGDFITAVEALFTTQRLATSSGSAAGGDHLAFMGSGRVEEDQYVVMVVANVLQRGHQYVSLISGGYIGLHHLLMDDLQGNFDDHDSHCCLVCSPATPRAFAVHNNESFRSADSDRSADLLGKLSKAVKTKSVSVMDRLSGYVKSVPAVDRHVSDCDRLGKRYRNMTSVFSIGDDDDDEEGDGGMCKMSDYDHRESVSLDTWLSKPDTLYHCQCQQVAPNGATHPSTLLLTRGHLYVLRNSVRHTGMAFVQARRSLGSVVRITSKKRCPELITFSYGSHSDDGFCVTNVDRFVIPSASEATKRVKQQIISVLSTASEM